MYSVKEDYHATTPQSVFASDRLLRHGHAGSGSRLRPQSPTLRSKSWLFWTPFFEAQYVKAKTAPKK
jgi:hypothetical protein